MDPTLLFALACLTVVVCMVFILSIRQAWIHWSQANNVNLDNCQAEQFNKRIPKIILARYDKTKHPSKALQELPVKLLLQYWHFRFLAD